MSLNSQSKTWLRKSKWYFIIGVPLICFALIPSPIGLGMIYLITDTLRGHPEGPHGAHPQRFAGLWIRDESVEFDFLGQAFYLMPDGRFAGMAGMTQRRWHFDDGRLFLDAVSRCGSCYQGNVTTEHTVTFIGANQMLVTNKDMSVTRGISGRYRRVEIDASLKADMNRWAKSTDDEQSFRARMVLYAINQFEFLSKVKK